MILKPGRYFSTILFRLPHHNHNNCHSCNTLELSIPKDVLDNEVPWQGPKQRLNLSYRL